MKRKIWDLEINLKSTGLTGEKWLNWLRGQGWVVDEYAEAILLSPDFAPTKGIFSKIVFRKPMPVHYIGEVKNEAKMLGLKNPSAETLCLLCEYFSEKTFKEMDLFNVVIMHNPITCEGPGGIAGNLCIVLPPFSGETKKITALSLKDNDRVSDGTYVFEKEI